MMYKKGFLLCIVICIISALFVGCDGTDNTETKNAIETEFADYCKKTMDYNYSNIKFTAEDDGTYYSFLEIIDAPQNLQNFSSQALDVSKEFCQNNNLKFGKINTVILYGVEKYCGWVSDSGKLYSDEFYPIAEHVDINSISDKLAEKITFSDSTTPSQIYASDDQISWEIVSTQEYVRKNEKCIGYRVYINVNNASDNQLLNIYKEITESDNYYLHTVWYYYNKSAATGSGTANAIIEQKVHDIDPIDVVRN